MKEDLILVSYLFNLTLTHYVMFILRALSSGPGFLSPFPILPQAPTSPPMPTYNIDEGEKSFG